MWKAALTNQYIVMNIVINVFLSAVKLRKLSAITLEIRKFKKRCCIMHIILRCINTALTKKLH